MEEPEPVGAQNVVDDHGFIHLTEKLEHHYWENYPMAKNSWLGVDGEPQMLGHVTGLAGRLKRRNRYTTPQLHL